MHLSPIVEVSESNSGSRELKTEKSVHMQFDSDIKTDSRFISNYTRSDRK